MLTMYLPQPSCVSRIPHLPQPPTLPAPPDQVSRPRHLLSPWALTASATECIATSSPGFDPVAFCLRTRTRCLACLGISNTFLFLHSPSLFGVVKKSVCVPQSGTKHLHPHHHGHKQVYPRRLRHIRPRSSRLDHCS